MTTASAGPVNPAGTGPQGSSGASGGAPPIKRRFKNYLLDPVFQLKYTGMVMGVTLVVAGVLGYIAYQQSHAQTEMLTVNMAMAGETAEFIEQTAREADQVLLLQIIAGVLILALSLGITGILVTHRVVGPAYKMKSLFRDVSEGHLRVRGRLRKGDELKDVFDEFEVMIEKLRARQREEITQLEAIIERAKGGGDAYRERADGLVSDLDELRGRMEAELQTK
jgi:nitrogen fixation/metabolism regulation signal transduction histidine kinase